MVTGNEYIFEDIDQALDYVLDTERRALAADPHRQNPPVIIRPNLGMHPVPVDSLDYPLGAWFNNESDDKFVMTRLMSVSSATQMSSEKPESHQRGTDPA